MRFDFWSAFFSAIIIHVAIFIVLRFVFFSILNKDEIVIVSPKSDVISVEEAAFEIPVPKPVQLEEDIVPEVEMEDLTLENLAFDSLASESFDDSPRNDLYDPFPDADLPGSSGTMERILKDHPDGKEISAIKERVEKAGGKSGEVQFSLAWDTSSDLDLHVIAPDGDRIYYDSRRSRCFGELDVDANAKKIVEEPVENIRWLESPPRSGRYTVLVHLFQPRGRDRNVKFELVGKTGENLNLQKAQVTVANRLKVFRFYYFNPSIAPDERDELLQKLKRLQEKEEKEAKKVLSNIRFGDNEKLWEIVVNYPHTDSAVEALKRIRGSSRK